MKDFLVKSYCTAVYQTSGLWTMNSYPMMIYLDVTNDTDNDYSKLYEKITSHQTVS